MKLFYSKPGLKVLFVAAEAAPFAEVGGLGSIMYSLPKALERLGHDVRVMIPRYLSIDSDRYHLNMEYEGLKVPTGNEKGPSHLVCNVKKYEDKKNPENPVVTYFLENQEYYEQRANVYGYADDPIRWALLSRGALEFLRVKQKWVPDIIVASDWSTGYLANYLRTEYKNDPVLSKMTAIFSIHNLYHQGMFDHKFVQELDYDDGHSPIPGFDNPRLFKINAMRRGIMYSDAINTVSPTYAREIMTKDYGELLEDLLQERRAVIFGILNGIDYNVWNPKKDPAVPFCFSDMDMDRRAKNKMALQEKFGLPVDKNAFVVSIVARLIRQKGFDLLFNTIETLLQELPMQFLIVGEGDADLMGFFHDLANKMPKKVSAHLKFDPVLPHLVYAGTDVILIPSRFEPSGLTQMEAMRYGAIPIVRKTGGLADTVDDYNPEKQTGTGFVFEKFDSSSFMIAFIRAFENFRNKKEWKSLQKRALLKDFSWDTSAKKYAEMFRRAMEIHNQLKTKK